MRRKQYDALAALAFNAPSASGPNSSVVRGVNGGHLQAAADAILLYDKGHLPDHTVVTPKGLPPRRRADRNVLLKGVYDSNH